MFHKSDFKKNDKAIKQALYQYKIMKVRLNNRTLLTTSVVDDQTAEEYEKYIQAIETILGAMNKESATILQSVHLKSVDKNELGFSTSTFYNKYRKAAVEFLEMMS